MKIIFACSIVFLIALGVEEFPATAEGNIQKTQILRIY